MKIRPFILAILLVGPGACDTEGTECDSDDECDDGQECGTPDCSSDTYKRCMVFCDSDADCEEFSSPDSHCFDNPLPDCFDYCSEG